MPRLYLDTVRQLEERTARQRPWWLNVTLLPALLVAALPKCPLCLVAYAGVLGTLGLDPFLYRTWLMPVTLVFSAATLAVLAFRAPCRRGYRPFVVGSVAVALIVAGKFVFDNTPLLVAGMALLLAASVWNAWPKKEKAAYCHC